ncbi:hypothetical protein CQW39_02990 [Streptomyces griseofuscus]|uniref:Lipoprotein n=1 Tax=Streptomyces griseofuscus TaxID=146922 RepID=A0A426RXP8_9ACTN|nr:MULTISPECIES: hypothetical protein [Streptomyces]MYR85600.1 hypothetical protein [Streptomyces sp. SID685]RRQ79946.1 hypothetical protein CQW44_32930 [Streptomyces griseofuscus]RRQ82249.1 hypothetical protein CQW39_02990 [Streptomyces griseofuscus]
MQHSARAGRRSTVRAARRLAVLVPLVCALGALVSCSKQEEALTTPCGLVIDGSGSAAAAKEGFDSESKLKDTLGGFLTDQKCGTLDFAPVTRSSRSSSCRQDEVDLDPPHDATTDQKTQRADAQRDAAVAALAELKCARTQNGSDVWGALTRIGEAVPTGGPTPKLLVVSDFDQADPEFHLSRQDITTKTARAKVIDSLVDKRGMPGIKGMEVFPVGLGMQYKAKPSEAADFDSFWTEALEGRAKAHVDDKYRG